MGAWRGVVPLGTGVVHGDRAWAAVVPSEHVVGAPRAPRVHFRSTTSTSCKQRAALGVSVLWGQEQAPSHEARPHQGSAWGRVGKAELGERGSGRALHRGTETGPKLLGSPSAGASPATAHNPSSFQLRGCHPWEHSSSSVWPDPLPRRPGPALRFVVLRRGNEAQGPGPCSCRRSGRRQTGKKTRHAKINGKPHPGGPGARARLAPVAR